MGWLLMLAGAVVLVAATLMAVSKPSWFVHNGHRYSRNRVGEFFDGEGRPVLDCRICMELEYHFQDLLAQRRMEVSQFWPK